MSRMDLSFLDDRERSVVEDGLAVLRRHGSDDARMVEESLARLARMAEVVRTSPSIERAFHGRKRVSSETLVEVLCRVPDWDLDLHIPTKAVLGQAYLVAKINFFKGLAYALETPPNAGEVHERAMHEAGQSIYTKLAEELFVSIVTDAGTPRPVRERAARKLFHVWENRLEAEIDDFAPVLESVWMARNRVRPVLGTLKGTHELLRLVQQAADATFFDHFAADVDEEELQAFEEFLFGISHEEIQKLRAHLDAQRASVVSSDQARAILGRSKESWVPSGGPQDLYTSYKKRRVKAHYRALTDTPGPKKTSEEYVMVAFLEREDGD
jgi:hypothetical protein